MRPPEVFVRALSPEEGARLKPVSKKAKYQSKRQRAMIVLASSTGMSAPQIAAMARTDESHVRKVIHAFNERGFGSLDPDYRGGRPKKTTPEQRDRIVAVARARPDTQGVALTRWSLAKLSEHLAGLGIVLCEEALRQTLRGAGLSHQRTRSQTRRLVLAALDGAGSGAAAMIGRYVAVLAAVVDRAVVVALVHDRVSTAKPARVQASSRASAKLVSCSLGRLDRPRQRQAGARADGGVDLVAVVAAALARRDGGAVPPRCVGVGVLAHALRAVLGQEPLPLRRREGRTRRWRRLGPCRASASRKPAVTRSMQASSSGLRRAASRVKR